MQTHYLKISLLFFALFFLANINYAAADVINETKEPLHTEVKSAPIKKNDPLPTKERKVVPIQLAGITTGHLIITATREPKKQSQLSESTGVITSEDLHNISPSHPAEALNRIAGVHINNLGGEGHMTSIRQPITTAGVYLFLEDGLPTRPTGFFNHNGLYEINIPQSSRIEVIKGPGSALYGSDAIGGVINVISKRAPMDQEVGINLESGSHGWKRGLFSIGGGNQFSAARMDLNTSQNSGFREQADYERDSINISFESELSQTWQSRTLVSYSSISQSGISSLEEEDYKARVRKNFYHDDIGYREVDALRLSSEFNAEINENQLLTITPFYRNNTMSMMPSWMISYDPNLRTYDFKSYGLQMKYRHKMFNEQLEVIIGSDLDKTPSRYQEEKISVTQTNDIYTDYSKLGDFSYDFDAEQQSISPYVHIDYLLNEQWRTNIGVRYDKFSIDYIDNIANNPVDTRHLRPASQNIHFSKTSPKLGLIYSINNEHNVYANYRYAFSAPTVGSLFRSGSSENTASLNPMTSKSFEVGFRGQFSSRFDYDLTLYTMAVEDQIVSIIDNGSRNTVNAGETQHEGIELGLDIKLSQDFQLGYSFTRTKQVYENFSYVFYSTDCFCSQEINFAGNDIALAPRSMSNARLAYSPKSIEGLTSEFEWESVGSYYTDPTNTQTYEGHDLYNLRISYTFKNESNIYLRVSNILNTRYSTYTSNQVNDSDLSYRPGSPRSYYLGFRWQL